MRDSFSELAFLLGRELINLLLQSLIHHLVCFESEGVYPTSRVEHIPLRGAHPTGQTQRILR